MADAQLAQSLLLLSPSVASPLIPSAKIMGAAVTAPPPRRPAEPMAINGDAEAVAEGMRPKVSVTQSTPPASSVATEAALKDILRNVLVKSLPPSLPRPLRRGYQKLSTEGEFEVTTPKNGASATSVKRVFPHQLWALVDGEDRKNGTVRWSEDGTTMIVLDCDTLVSTILPSYSIGSSSIASFFRQLNYYRYVEAYLLLLYNILFMTAFLL